MRGVEWRHCNFILQMCCLPASADELTGHTTSPVHQGRVTCILFPSVSQNLIVWTVQRDMPSRVVTVDLATD